MSLSYTQAFAKYGATLNNQIWSVSAFGSDGCLVVSLWQPLLKPGEQKGTLVYQDTLSLWKGNDDGRNELRRHLAAVAGSGVAIKLVIAHPASPEDAALVGQVTDERKIKKTFSVRPELVGKLEEFANEDVLRIVFRRLG
jgi:hypothetical protein